MMFSKKVSLSICLMFFLVIHLSAQAHDTLWTKIYGGMDEDQGYCVQQTSDGGYIITGETWSYGAGSSDVYLIKTDANGDTLWTRVYGGPQEDIGFSVQETFDGGYIVVGKTGSFGSGVDDVYIIKTDANGDTMWTRAYGGAGLDRGDDVLQTADGRFIIVGRIYVSNEDVWLIKTDASGDTLWTKTYGGSLSDCAMSLRQTTDSGYIIVGSTCSYGAGQYDLYIIRTDENGDTLWTRVYGGEHIEHGNSVQQTTDGGYIITGRTQSFGPGTPWGNVWLLKTDINGDTLWTRVYGGLDWDQGRAVLQTDGGGYIIAGKTESYGAGEADIYLIRTDSLGDPLWMKTYGTGGAELAGSMQRTSDGGYIIAGCRTLFGPSDWDVWLLKTKPEVGIEENASNLNICYNLSINPNPFKSRTTISYSLLQRSNVRIRIFNSAGQMVRMLMNSEGNPGGYLFFWDGKDQFGKRLPTGVYFLSFEIEDTKETRKIMIVR